MPWPLRAGPGPSALLHRRRAYPLGFRVVALQRPGHPYRRSGQPERGRVQDQRLPERGPLTYTLPALPLIWQAPAIDGGGLPYIFEFDPRGETDQTESVDGKALKRLVFFQWHDGIFMAYPPF